MSRYFSILRAFWKKGLFDCDNSAAPSGLKYNGLFVAIIMPPFQGFLEEGFI
jgi:hypothetical protein